MKFFLIVAKGKRRGYPIPVDVDLFVIGSGKSCQLRAVHDGIGQQHCAVAVRGRKAFVRDLGSGHPTVLNGAEMSPSEEIPLHKGDLLVVGPLHFLVSFHERQLTKTDMEEWALRTLDDDTGPKKSALEELAEFSRAPTEADCAAAAAGAAIASLSAQKGIVRGRLRIMREGTVTIVRVMDNFLVEESELLHTKRELYENLDAPNLRVLLDLKSVVRMSSAAANILADFAEWLHRHGSTLALCRLRPELGSVVADLSNIFQVRSYPSKELALSAKW